MLASAQYTQRGDLNLWRTWGSEIITHVCSVGYSTFRRRLPFRFIFGLAPVERSRVTERSGVTLPRFPHVAGGRRRRRAAVAAPAWQAER